MCIRDSASEFIVAFVEVERGYGEGSPPREQMACPIRIPGYKLGKGCHRWLPTQLTRTDACRALTNSSPLPHSGRWPPRPAVPRPRLAHPARWPDVPDVAEVQ